MVESMLAVCGVRRCGYHRRVVVSVLCVARGDYGSGWLWVMFSLGYETAR
jgi:hypothetical protein